MEPIPETSTLFQSFKDLDRLFAVLGHSQTSEIHLDARVDSTDRFIGAYRLKDGTLDEFKYDWERKQVSREVDRSWTNPAEQFRKLEDEGASLHVRLCHGGRLGADMTHAQVIVWEIDQRTENKGSPLVPKEEQWQIIRDLETTIGQPVSLVVDSKKSLHCYLKLEEPISVADFVQLSKRMALYIQQKYEVYADPTYSSAKTFRTPGFTHKKDPEHPHPVTIVQDSGSSFSHESLSFLPELPTPEPRPPRAVEPVSSPSELTDAIVEAAFRHIQGIGSWDADASERLYVARIYTSLNAESDYEQLYAQKSNRQVGDDRECEKFLRNGRNRVYSIEEATTRLIGYAKQSGFSASDFTKQWYQDHKEPVDKSVKLRSKGKFQEDMLETHPEPKQPEVRSQQESEKPVVEQRSLETGERQNELGRNSPEKDVRSENPPKITAEITIEEPTAQERLNRKAADLARAIVRDKPADGNEKKLQGKTTYTIILNTDTNTLKIYARDRGKDPILIDADGSIDHAKSRIHERDVQHLQNALNKLRQVQAEPPRKYASIER